MTRKTITTVTVGYIEKIDSCIERHEGRRESMYIES